MQKQCTKLLWGFFYFFLPSASISFPMEWKLFLPSSLHVFVVSMNPRVGVGPHNLIIAGSYQCESETQDQTVYYKSVPAAL